MFLTQISARFRPVDAAGGGDRSQVDNVYRHPVARHREDHSGHSARSSTDNLWRGRPGRRTPTGRRLGLHEQLRSNICCATESIIFASFVFHQFFMSLTIFFVSSTIFLMSLFFVYYIYI